MKIFHIIFNSQNSNNKYFLLHKVVHISNMSPIQKSDIKLMSIDYVYLIGKQNRIKIRIQTE